MINIFKGEQILMLINICNVTAEKLLKLQISFTDDLTWNDPFFLSANYEKDKNMINNWLMMHAQYKNIEANLPIVHSEGDSS